MYDVVIPLFNKAATIERCLQSVAEQTLPVNRVIVVNDGSTDNSVSVIKKFLVNAGIDLLLIEQENQGVSAARNRGIKASTGELVCLLDADDAWHPRYVETMHALVSDYPGASLYCLGHLLFEDGETVKPKHGCSEGFRGYIENFFVASARGSVANSSKVALRRATLEKVGGFPEGIHVGEDLFTWIRLASAGRVACDSTPMVTVYREHDEKRLTRQDGVPYPIIYFGAHKQEMRRIEGLKQYLIKVGLLHVAGSSLQGNLRGGFIRAKAVLRLSLFWGVMSLGIILIPSQILRLVKHRRSS